MVGVGLRHCDPNYQPNKSNLWSYQIEVSIPHQRPISRQINEATTQEEKNDLKCLHACYMTEFHVAETFLIVQNPVYSSRSSFAIGA